MRVPTRHTVFSSSYSTGVIARIVQQYYCIGRAKLFVKKIKEFNKVLCGNEEDKKTDLTGGPVFRFLVQLQTPLQPDSDCARNATLMTRENVQRLLII